MKLQKLLLSAVTVGLIAGVLAATPALANDDESRKHKVTSARQTVQVSKRAFNQTSPLETVLIEDVPEGRRLVMQHVSIEVKTANNDDATVTCRLAVDADPTNSWLSLRVTKRRTGNLDQHLAEGPITLYAEAGNQVRATCVAVKLDSQGNTEPATAASFDTTLVGYLVKAR